MTGKRFATMDGRLDLIIPPDGQHGFGLGQGDVFVYFPHEDSTGLETAADPLYEARFRTCWQAEEVRCQPSGEITYKARSLIRTCIGKPIGHLPDGGTLAQSDVTPWTFTWVLTPDLTNEFRMTIAVKTDVAVWSSASGEAEKHLGRYL
jgi:hypothetical protein